ncbi:uncharacterized protein LOC124449369 [Xenia sp. Carnegie-2017]|uniref:uncharacterized protein LOC124449369 n=1 Tax=Xenia sp. Carnegie-2017 TaxID=2897299 RepID=UPI001F03BA1A|nr:uncharacterized protein LOC124449369 [Xenia sp. Carnegie-2017]
MSRRTKNSLSTLTDADIKSLILKLPKTDEAKEKDIPSERSPKDKGNKTKENEKCTEPNDKEPKLRAHVVDVEKFALTLPSTDKIVSKKLDIDDNASKLDQILTRLGILEEKSKHDDNEKAVLLVDNAKMAAEIDHLKFSISMLREDNNRILSLLDNNQNAWIDANRKNEPKTNRKNPTTNPLLADSKPTTDGTLTLSNTFQVLANENICPSPEKEVRFRIKLLNIDLSTNPNLK